LIPEGAALGAAAFGGAAIAGVVTVAGEFTKDQFLGKD
jgi:hypothetical protein